MSRRIFAGALHKKRAHCVEDAYERQLTRDETILRREFRLRR